MSLACTSARSGAPLPAASCPPPSVPASSTSTGLTWRGFRTTPRPPLAWHPRARPHSHCFPKGRPLPPSRFRAPARRCLAASRKSRRSRPCCCATMCRWSPSPALAASEKPGSRWRLRPGCATPFPTAPGSSISRPCAIRTWCRQRSPRRWGCRSSPGRPRSNASAHSWDRVRRCLSSTTSSRSLRLGRVSQPWSRHAPA